MSSQVLARAVRLGRVRRVTLLAALVTVVLCSTYVLSQVRSDQGQFNRKGNILISDQFNNRAIEVTHNKNPQIVATFTAGGTASGVAFASRLPNGYTLLTDSNNNRAVEVDKKDTVVWEYVTNLETGSNPNPLPTRALRLENGNTIISDQFNDRVIVVDLNKKIVARYGNLNVVGYGLDNTSQGLFAPYDAKVIGDYTGITPPQ